MNDHRTIGILGLARSGRAAAELALAAGLPVYASDAGDSPALRDAAAAIRRAGGRAEVGRHDAKRLADCERIVVSPGIPPDAAILRDPDVRDVPVVSELEFAYGHLRAPVIAVTGTNGKTTTTALAAHLLRTAGLDSPAAGNIGLALSDIARRESPPDWVVVETSSFQLGRIERFAPRIGAVTNLSPDHLDRYPSVDAYYADKARLFANANEESVWVLNADDPAVERLAGDSPGRRLRFRAGGPLADRGAAAGAGPAGVADSDGAERAAGAVGTDGAAGTAGAWLEDDMLVLRLDDGAPVHLLSVDDLQLLGEHNVANALAAALLAAAAGADADSMRDGLRSFRPIEHRLQPVVETDGVLWVNDSKATNVESARVALRSVDRPIVLLLGGRPKGERFVSLAPEMAERVRMVVAFGEAATEIEAQLAELVPVERIDGPFEAVVDRARTLARPGDAVLLSPACASFDMFDDFADRGRRFVELAGEREREGVSNGA